MSVRKLIRIMLALVILVHKAQGGVFTCAVGFVSAAMCRAKCNDEWAKCKILKSDAFLSLFRHYGVNKIP